MKKVWMTVMSMSLLLSSLLTGCSTKAEKENLNQAETGHVSEAQGTEDSYGWTPHLRLTFDGDKIVKTYFDYINADAEKKSEDSTYVAGMKEKTGIGVDEAMRQLSEQLLQVQDPDQVDIVTGATQTSQEFITLAKAAYDNYKQGTHKNNPLIIDTATQPQTPADTSQ